MCLKCETGWHRHPTRQGHQVQNVEGQCAINNEEGHIEVVAGHHSEGTVNVPTTTEQLQTPAPQTGMLCQRNTHSLSDRL